MCLGLRCVLLLGLCSLTVWSGPRLIAKQLAKTSSFAWELRSARLAAHDTHRFAAVPVVADRALRIYLSASTGSSVALTLFDNHDDLISERNGSDHYEFYILPDEDAQYSAVIVSENSRPISYSFSISVPDRVPPEEANTAVESSPSFASVKVFYATDRRPTGGSTVATSFGSDPRSAGVAFGTATVTVPRDHRMGEIEQPRFLHFEYRPDPAKHLTIASMTYEVPEEFLRTIRAHVHDSKRREILLFIHGYNTSFESGILRTAQLTYDLGFDGPPLLYSWPSSAKLLSYNTKDERNALLSGANLRDVLDELLRRTDAQSVHVIAHSMGGRVLTRALELMGKGDGAANLTDAVLMAPGH